MTKWVRYAALVIGIIYAIAGIMGLLSIGLQPPAAGEPVPLVNSQYGYLLGLFPVNILHNLFHLVVGILGVIAYRSWEWSHTYNRAVAIVYAVLTIMGLIPGLSTTFGLIPLFGNDVWLHLLTVVVAGYFGFFAINRTTTTNLSDTARTHTPV